jgi:hypothetical protein
MPYALRNGVNQILGKPARGVATSPQRAQVYAEAGAGRTRVDEDAADLLS